MPQLPAEWSLCLPALPSLRLGSCDRDGNPHVCRALAADVLPDGRMLVLLAEHAAPQVVAALRETAQVAMLATSPRTNRTLHLKGRDARVEPALPAHAELLALRRNTLTQELAEVDGFAGAPFLDRWYGVQVHELVAVRYTVAGAWDQTPGPHAGQAVELEPGP
ncbi:pyridoxamine 5'-phosphate oxidase family protein [Achromobacter aegrifaciens]